MDILGYLVSHPNAQDTLEGIAQWWLLEQHIRQSIAEVKAAVEELVKRGWVLEIKQKDGRTHYCLDREKVPEIRRFLEEMKRASGRSEAEYGTEQ